LNLQITYNKQLAIFGGNFSQILAEIDIKNSQILAKIDAINNQNMI